MSWDDEDIVRRWLYDYMQHHIAGWVEVYGLPWTPQDIRAHIQDHSLVDRDYAELLKAVDDPHTHIELAVEGDTPLGIVQAGQQTDYYLCGAIGVISWVYVCPEARHRGISTQLLQRAQAWMRGLDLHVAEVYVTQSNTGAIRSYEKVGFNTLDARLVAP
ncbi:MAG: GNAT family N-acetyltransferase [Bradymonadia bacterium]